MYRGLTPCPYAILDDTFVRGQKCPYTSPFFRCDSMFLDKAFKKIATKKKDRQLFRLISCMHALEEEMHLFML